MFDRLANFFLVLTGALFVVYVSSFIGMVMLGYSVTVVVPVTANPALALLLSPVLGLMFHTLGQHLDNN